MLYVYPKHIKYTISIDSLLFSIIPDDFDNPMIKSLNLPTLSVALCFAAVQKQAPRRDARVSLLGRWIVLVGDWASEKYEFITWCKIRNSMDQHVPNHHPVLYDKVTNRIFFSDTLITSGGVLNKISHVLQVLIEAKILSKQ